MPLRDFISHVVHPRTRARLIAFEQKLTRFLLGLGTAKYVQPFLIKRYLARPEEVDIEVTSVCDADCIMCPRKAMRRKMGPMDLELFKKIIDDAVELGVRKLCLNGYGEIATLKNYKEYLSYIRRKSRWIKIIINTNGMRMNEDMARFYVEVGVDVVNVTIDGATATTYESIRRYLRLDVVESNVKRLIRIRDEMRKRRPLVMLQMIYMPQNCHEVDLFLEKWRGVADHVGISGLVSRAGSIDFAKVNSSDWHKTPCFLLWSQMPILSDGTVALCCDDWDGEAALGNLGIHSIKDIWTNEQRKRLRSLHLSGRGAAIDSCEGCRQPRQGPWWFGN